MSPPADKDASAPNAARPRDAEPPIYSKEDRAFLLSTAHAAIAAALADAERRAPTLRGELPPQLNAVHLNAPRGAFTTLHLAGKLRGCVGYIAAAKPLIQTVAETAVSAAFYDPRFPPVSANEAPHLHIEISVLSLPEPIRPEHIVPGRHGLIVTHGTRRGLLLPQVAEENGWDAPTFLAQTCIKAGLPADAWQTGATIEAFTAEVFGEV